MLDGEEVEYMIDTYMSQSTRHEPLEEMGNVF
jgi:hypothetical protein